MIEEMDDQTEWAGLRIREVKRREIPEGIVGRRYKGVNREQIDASSRLNDRNELSANCTRYISIDGGLRSHNWYPISPPTKPLPLMKTTVVNLFPLPHLSPLSHTHWVHFRRDAIHRTLHSTTCFYNQ